MYTSEPVEFFLAKPDLGTKQDEQHPSHRENRGEEQSSLDCNPGESPGFGSCHLPAMRRLVCRKYLAAGDLIMPAHAIHVHVADDPAIIVIESLTLCIHWPNPFFIYRDGKRLYAPAPLPWYGGRISCTVPNIPCSAYGTCTPPGDWREKECYPQG
jgi:hypothetical protein